MRIYACIYKLLAIGQGGLKAGRPEREDNKMQFRKHLFYGAMGHKTTKCFQSVPFLASSQLTGTLHRLCHPRFKVATEPYSHLTLEWHNE